MIEDKIKNLREAQALEDAQTALPKRFEPKQGEKYYSLAANNTIAQHSFSSFNPLDHARYDLYNCFRTAKEAAVVRKDLTHCSAIIMACRLVDPNYVPDWSNTDKSKWCPRYSESIGWCVDYSFIFLYASSYVSTKEKAQQVCDLLTEWGVTA